MFRSGLGKFDKPKGAASLPLGLFELVGLNLALQAVAVGYSAALFRRDLFEPFQSILQRLAYPVITDLVVLFVLGRLAMLLTEIPHTDEVPGTMIDRSLAAGAPWWLGYALGVLFLRFIFLLANWPPTRGWFVSMQGVFDFLPAYRGVTQLARWHQHHWLGALAFVGVCGLFGALWIRRRAQPPVLLRNALRAGVVIVLLASVPAAQRAFSSWRPAVAGDLISAKLIATPQIGAADWQPQGLTGRITLVEFWTTWCGACKRILPKLRQLKKGLPDARFELLLVNVEGRGNPSPKLLKAIENYKAKRAPELAVLIDRGAWSDAVGITVYPTLALIGPKGRLLKLWSGTPSISDVDQAVRHALSGRAGL
jgi:thiol-disulfide isomerase/thioredoxin